MAKRVSHRLQTTSLKNKMFLATTLVILLISIPIAVFTRWILISTLTSELKLRGLGIAESIAESGRSHILTNNIPRLVSMIFDARLGERKLLINYIFILDKQGQILAHTFTRPFPEKLHGANRLGPDQSSAIRLLRTGNTDVYDIAVPVREGIYLIGSVHVGLYKKHIDQLIAKLRSTFLGFVSVMTIFCFIVSHWLARYIARPISRLTQVSDELSRGNFDVRLDLSDRVVEKGSVKTGRPTKDEVHQLADSFANMTRRIKQSQAKLRESEQKYRSLFASGPNPIFVIDRGTYEIMDVNPTAEEIYGYARSELIGQHFNLLGPFEFNPADIDRCHRSGTSQTTMLGSRLRYSKKGRTAIYVNVQVCPMQYADKEALIVATTDITEMVEKDNQLIQFSKLKTLGEMAAGIAHELNQPLNAIKMGSEFLEMMIEEDRKVLSQDLMTVVSEVSRQVDRASDIITRLRDFGRKSDFTRERISLNLPVSNVLKILGRQLELQNIAVDLDLDPDPPIILVHSNRVEQVIFNLLTNARDALNQKAELHPELDRRIRIRTFHQDNCAVATVADNGTGIPEVVQKRIFDAFFTTKEMGEGMGMGLSISNSIVGNYGGRIEVLSREGQGTTFTLSFPLADSAGELE